MSAAVFAVRKVTIDAGSWTPVVPPGSFDNVAIWNQGAVTLYVRSDDGDALTELPVSAGVTQTIAVPFQRRYPVLYRFSAGQVGFYLKAASGSVEVTLIWA